VYVNIVGIISVTVY